VKKGVGSGGALNERKKRFAKLLSLFTGAKKPARENSQPKKKDFREKNEGREVG